MTEVTLHLDILEDPQEEVLRATGPTLTDRGFRLGGGTALALVYGHRRSVDFDWFLDQPLTDPMRLAADLRRERVGMEVSSVSEGTLHAAVDGVPVSLFQYLYPHLDEPLTSADPRVSLLSLDDVACMKLSAIAQRGARKDFVDLYVLGTEHRRLAEMLDLYRRKYEVDETGHLLYALGYFDDAERDRMPEMLWEVGWEEMRGRIEGWVRRVANGG